MLKSKRARRLTALACVLALAATPLAYWLLGHWSRERELDALLAELDATEPGWRFEQMVEDRAPVPDDRNLAVQVAKVLAFGKNHFAMTEQEEGLFAGLPAPRELDDRQLEVLRLHLDQIPEVRSAALACKDLTQARFPITYRPEWVTTTVDPVEHVRDVGRLLLYDALLRAHEGDLGGAVQACHALLEVAGGAADEPYLVAWLVRFAYQDRAVTAGLEHVLAQGEPPGDALRAVQECLDRQAADSGFGRAVRGERAGYDQMFRALADGTVSYSHLLNIMRANGRQSSRVQAMFRDHFPSATSADRLRTLQRYNRLVAASRLPTEQQAEAFEQIERDQDRDEPPLGVVRLKRLAGRNCELLAHLRGALAAVAAERFRQKEGHWPESPDVLVRAGLLASVPADPFDGRPLRLRRLPDGVMVYSVGPNRADDGGTLDRDNSNAPGIDMGFRLWDVRARRQPAAVPGNLP